MRNLIKNLLFALGLAVIVFVGYKVFFTGGSDVVQVVGGASMASIDSQRYLQDLQKVQQIELNTGILNEARFNSLKDLRQDLGTEAVGRTNPFAPIGE